MATSQEYLDFVLEQLSELEGITTRPMMGEFLLYYRGKYVGGVCDNLLLLKPTEQALALLPHARYALPYEGAREMLLVEEPEDRQSLCALVRATYDALPAPRPRKKRQV